MSTYNKSVAYSGSDACHGQDSKVKYKALSDYITFSDMCINSAHPNPHSFWKLLSQTDMVYH